MDMTKVFKSMQEKLTIVSRRGPAAVIRELREMEEDLRYLTGTGEDEDEMDSLACKLYDLAEKLIDGIPDGQPGLYDPELIGEDLGEYVLVEAKKATGNGAGAFCRAGHVLDDLVDMGVMTSRDALDAWRIVSEYHRFSQTGED